MFEKVYVLMQGFGLAVERGDLKDATYYLDKIRNKKDVLFKDLAVTIYEEMLWRLMEKSEEGKKQNKEHEKGS